MRKIYFILSFMVFSFASLAQVNTLTESFDAASPAGWTVQNLSNPVGTTTWVTGGSAIPELGGYIGAGHARVNYNSTAGAGTISNWFISPVLNLKDGAVITFYTRTPTGSAYADRLEVRLSTAGTSTNVGTTESSVGDFTILACTINPALTVGNSSGGCGNLYPQSWTQYTITVSGVGGTAVPGRVAFRYYVTNGGPSGTNSNLIGLDEFSFDNTVCTTPTPGTASAPATACNNALFNLTLTGYSPSGAAIQWQSSPVGAGTWTNVAGATSAVSPVSQPGARDYRASVTCPGGGAAVYSNTITVNTTAVNCPPACTNNLTPANAATNVSYQPYISFSWTAAAGATSYDVYYGTTTTPSFAGNVAGTSAIIQNQSPNTTYYWYVVPKNANGTLATCASTMTSFTTGAAAAAPANDECAGAITLSAFMGGSPYNGTTISGTASAGITSCGVATTWGTPNEDVWFKFTTLNSGNATVTVVGGPTFDGVLQAFSGTCGSLVQLGTCTDATANAGTETMSLTGLTAATTYYLRVYDWESGGGDNFTISLSGTALPVSLADFNGRSEGSVNILTWNTKSESNNKGFELQRSADGANYTTIGNIASKAENGNSSVQLNYQFNDARPLSGINYYRLKQVDYDGRFSFSGVVTLKSKVSEIIISSVYPNPARNEVKLVISSPAAERATVVVTDLTGKVIVQRSVQLAMGDNHQQFNIQSLSAGTYLVKLVCDSGCETAVQRFVKY